MHLSFSLAEVQYSGLYWETVFLVRLVQEFGKRSSSKNISKRNIDEAKWFGKVLHLSARLAVLRATQLPTYRMALTVYQVYVCIYQIERDASLQSTVTQTCCYT